MPKNPLNEWERKFRSAAKADNLALFRDHLRNLNLPDKPELLLEGTILVVQACCIYLDMDGRLYSEFLGLQKYNPADIRSAKYAFTFEISDKAFARVLIKRKHGSGLDLADLYEHPWNKYKVAGYKRICISRADGKDLTEKQKAQLEEDVTYDLRYEYDEDELDFWFDDSTIEGVLWVELNDVFE